MFCLSKVSVLLKRNSMGVIKRNNVKVSGEGIKTLFFVHGYGCNQNMWRFILPAFENRFKVVLIDLLGSGDSDVDEYDFEKYSSLEAHADDIIAVCEELSLSQVTLIGHSVSSMIGAHVAAKRGDLIDKLIMICPSPKYINDGDYVGGFEETQIQEMLETLESNYLGWSSAITPAIMGNPNRPELTKELETSFCRSVPEIAKHFARVTFLGDDREILGKVSTKTLILYCQPDFISPEEVSKYVHRSILGSSISLLKKAQGHCPQMSAPEETIAAINEFLIN